MSKKIRVIMSKVGLDGHSRGALVVARALRDAGAEIIYTGLHQTPETVVASAIQEDADVIGVSILSGAHMTYIPRILDLLKQKGANGIKVIAGGCIDYEDIPKLKEMGVAEIFPTGTTLKAITDYVANLAKAY